jgi:hypothetical protein
MSNPLGSKKGKHQVTVFYWSLVNLPPQWRSQLKIIKLLGIVNSKLQKLHGCDYFLQPFINDIQKLAEGIEINFRGNIEKMFGVLLNYVGDMPAANSLHWRV